MAKYTISWNKTTTVTGLPEHQVRGWDNNIKIKFYHRGVKSVPTLTANEGYKIPRNETQLYVNGKYFI